MTCFTNAILIDYFYKPILCWSTFFLPSVGGQNPMQFDQCNSYTIHSTNMHMGLALLFLWGRMTHICVSVLTIIGSDNDLSPGRYQSIIWTDVGILSIGTIGASFRVFHLSFFLNWYLHWCCAEHPAWICTERPLVFGSFGSRSIYTLP